jgi:bacterioferritin-associated ferredoxin
MYVCLCNAVTDKEIAQAVSDGAHNLSSVQNTTGAATGCGSCQRTTEIIIDQCLAEKLINAA